MPQTYLVNNAKKQFVKMLGSQLNTHVSKFWMRWHLEEQKQKEEDSIKGRYLLTFLHGK